MKIGVFGGTFNPIHYGHLINAHIILEDFKLDKIIFIPTKMPVHKDLACNLSPEHRYAMVELAIQDNNKFSVSRMEIDRTEPSYSILTIRELKEQNQQATFFLIVGEDSYNEIHTWKEYKKLLANVTLIVMRRPGNNEGRNNHIEDHANILYAHNPVIDISSTYIRERIRENKTINCLMPGSVIDYINDKRLYKN